MVCSNSGANLAAEARFCASCGTPVAAAGCFTSVNESSDPELVQAQGVADLRIFAVPELWDDRRSELELLPLLWTLD